ncbi:MAG: ribosome recycling factor [Pseudomonadota bacterium]
MDLASVKNITETRMKKTLASFEESIAKLRAGRASPSILDKIRVSYFGNDVPLSQVASISVEGPLTITLKPWEKALIAPIEKAIRASDLGLNPSTSGDTIRVPLPALTEERRKELIKHLKSEAEETKVALRNVRRDGNQELEQGLKAKTLTEDFVRQAKEAVQKLTDVYAQKIDKVVAAKEQDLMDI